MQYYLTVDDRGRCFDPMKNEVAHIINSDLNKLQLLRYLFESTEPMGIQYFDQGDFILLKFNDIELKLQLISRIDLLKLCNDLVKCSKYYDGLKLYIKHCVIEVNNKIFNN